MTESPERLSLEDLPPQVAYLFAPLDKRALGVAVGIVLGLAVALVTMAHMQIEPRPELHIGLLGHYLPGYNVSVRGALVGSVWGFLIGFVAGWLLAFTRNLVLTAWLMLTRSRAELDAARDLLDHI